MAISWLPHLFFFSLLVITSMKDLAPVHGQCLEDQKTLLLELKSELIFNSSYSLTLVRWNRTNDCCSWAGVECDGAGHVISLQLDRETISGGIEESSSLFYLRYLKKLNLANNEFNTTQIPRGIHRLSYLTHLNLSNAGFGGPIPPTLGNLTELVYLDLSFNFFSGLIPSFNMSKKITTIDLSHNSLRGSLSYLHFDGLSNLARLVLESNSLSGSIPHSLFAIPSLQSLLLSINQFSGQVNEFPIVNISNLNYLDLNYNSLSGRIPHSLFHLPSLESLYLSNNQFSGFPIVNISSIENLDLSNNLSYNSLSGRIPHSLFHMPSLEFLRLSNNQFSEFPIVNISSIEELDLSYNSFSSSIPSCLFGLSSLKYLHLSNNQFSGQVDEFPILNISKLIDLDLSYNSLSGGIPHSLLHLPSLVTLDLSHNQFSEFPIVNISNLGQLDLSNNRLEGPIPDSFFHLKSLYSLWLSDNLFNGTFQLEKIQSLPNLKYLHLSYNSLTVDATKMGSSSYRFPQLYSLHLDSCNVYGLPANSSAFTQLYSLGLSSCNLYNFPGFIKQSPLAYLDLSKNWISEEIPSWIWEIGNATLYQLNLSCNWLVDLQKPYHIPTSLWLLDLHSNMLRGELPLTRSDYVDFSDNNFDKSIPPDFGNVPRRYVSLAKNSLSGAIPISLCNVVDLLVMDLSFNALSGAIPHCLFENLSELGVFNLKGNNISGDIPDTFHVNCSLQTLDLSDNNLGGRIPKSLGFCKQLEVMNVGSNNIDDSFPCMLSASLRVLVLRSNRFRGEIRCYKSWPNLQIIDIASNNFSGSLHPVNFSSWRRMMLESDARLKQNLLSYTGRDNLPKDYLDEVKLIIKGIELKLAKIRVDFTTIDFSYNNFHGEIPYAIGDLKLLYLLNLSHNSLTGTIPKSSGKLAQLGSLDLSMNQLTGMIPEELARLTFLSVLNLSYNKLVGVIPSGRQFQTFSADSFQGNPGLCGFPLNISCKTTDDDDLSPPEAENVREIEWEYVSAALGYVVGLGSIVWLLLFCRSFREKYFDKIDEVVEEIFDGRNRRRRVVKNQGRSQ